MKSSPRPPRRFSRWQTTKRTFVLGGIGPKTSHPSTSQEPKSSATQIPESDNAPAELQTRPVEKAGSDSDRDSTLRSQGSAKPRHVRRLRLNSSNLGADRTTDLSKLEKNPSKAEAQSQSRGVANGIDSSQKGSAGSPPVNLPATSSSQGRPNRKPSAKPSTRTSPNSENHVDISEIPGSSELDRDTEAQSQSPRKKSIRKPSANSSTRTSPNSENQADLGEISSVPPPGDDTGTRNQSHGKQNNTEHKENIEDVAGADKQDSTRVSEGDDLSAHQNSSSRNSKSLRGTGRRGALKEVSDSNLSNSSHAAAKDSSLSVRTSLRDRSKMKSPADLMQMRQYPEKYLKSDKKSPNISVKINDTKKTSTAVTSSRLQKNVSGNKTLDSAGLSQSSRDRSVHSSRKRSSPPNAEKSLNESIVYKKLGSKVHGHEMSSIHSPAKTRTRKTQGATSPDIYPMNSTAKTDALKKQDKSSPEVSPIHAPAKTQTRQKQGEKSHSIFPMNSTAKTNALKKQDRNSPGISPIHSPNKTETHKKTRLKGPETSQLHSTVETKFRKIQNEKSSEISETHSKIEVRTRKNQAKNSPENFMQHSTVEADSLSQRSLSLGKKQDKVSSVLQKNSQANKDLSRKGNQSTRSKHSGENSKEFSSSSNESFGGRSLRNRSKLATPQSLQEKRQYPISFYPSKMRTEILNASVSAKSKSSKKNDQRQLPVSKSGGSWNTSKQVHRNTTERSHEQEIEEEEDVFVRSEKVSLRAKQNKYKSELNKKSVAKGNDLKNPKPAKNTSSKTKLSNQALPLSLRRPIDRRPGPRGHSRQPGQERESSLVAQGGEDNAWQMAPPSTSAIKPGRAHPNARKASDIDNTLHVPGSKVLRKRKLVDQLSQVQDEGKVPKKSASQEPGRKVMLWCGEGPTRSAADVTAYDVIFQTALDMETEMSESAEDRHSQKLVKNIFSGFKRNMKAMIYQELKLKELEKGVRERQRRCKKLWNDVAEKQAENLRLEQEIALREKDTDSGVQKISAWLRGFERLSQRVLADEEAST
ncbi:hypothetical protein EGW08_019956 [Elysia chlorotica]|uniref:Uncharacterized protein n=1 Tax=Elysia chlorotica TaxID=188477 RepID=A0A3S0Z977_ELYCH|nr:hypothetical protein EGW08_019956 [Elysia chlorotica]